MIAILYVGMYSCTYGGKQFMSTELLLAIVMQFAHYCCSSALFTPL